MSETDILKKVQDKLDNERAKDIVTQMKNELDLLYYTGHPKKRYL